MNLWIKAAVVTPVIILLFFAHTIYDINTSQKTAASDYLAAITPPMPLIRSEVKLDTLLDSLPENANWFRPVFFEGMALRGMQKNRYGNWIAIFASSRGRLIKLGQNDEYDGVRVQSVSPRSCVVRYGNVERRFELP